MTCEKFREFGMMLTCPETAPDISVDDLEYWKRPLSLSNFEGNGELSFMRVKKREPSTGMLDMLPESAELYLSLDGTASVYFVAPSEDGGTPAPDMKKLRAFIYSGRGGVLVNPGIWHWTPFPLARDADFFLGLRNNVLIEKDGGVVQGEGQVIYHELREKVEIDL